MTKLTHLAISFCLCESRVSSKIKKKKGWFSPPISSAVLNRKAVQLKASRAGHFERAMTAGLSACFLIVGNADNREGDGDLAMRKCCREPLQVPDTCELRYRTADNELRTDRPLGWRPIGMSQRRGQIQNIRAYAMHVVFFFFFFFSLLAFCVDYVGLRWEADIRYTETCAAREKQTAIKKGSVVRHARFCEEDYRIRITLNAKHQRLSFALSNIK